MADDEYLVTCDTVEHAADWSEWAVFAEVAQTAPTMPGVYLFRTPREHHIIYVGIAGPRDRNGKRAPTGLRGRFDVYRGGRVTGFGQAVFDAALADTRFLTERLREAESGQPSRAVDWVRAAVDHFQPEVRWATVDDRPAALELEDRIVKLLRHYHLLNREAVRFRARRAR